MAADPTGIADGLNAYAYVNNNPVRLIDAKGTDGAAPPVPQPPAPPPQFSVQPLPLVYDSYGSQVGTDTGALGLAAAKVAEKSPLGQALEKKVLDTLKDQFLLSLKSNPVGTVVGVGLPALGLGGVVVALAVSNPQLNIPIVGNKSGRTLAAPLLSAGLEGVTGALTDDRAKLGVGYTEDTDRKPTYSASVELSGKGKDPDKAKLKVEAGFGAHPVVKAGVSVPFQVGDVKIDIVSKVVFPTGPERAAEQPVQSRLYQSGPVHGGSHRGPHPAPGQDGHRRRRDSLRKTQSAHAQERAEGQQRSLIHPPDKLICQH